MQLDIRFLRKILNIMQEKQSHYISTQEILDDIRADYDYMEYQDFKDFFADHLLLLRDNKLIENVSVEDSKLGIAYNTKCLGIHPCNIRLTLSGYDFLKVLNKNGIIDRIKNLTLTESLKICEHILIKGLDSFIEQNF